MTRAENEEPPGAEPKWEIGRNGRKWRSGEGWERYQLTPEKIEMHQGMLFFEDEQRLTMLALLLENVGVDQAVRLGDPQVWKDAVAHLDRLRQPAAE